MNEPIWIPVKGYEGLYEISTDGRINSLARWQRNSKGRGFIRKELILQRQISRSGYWVHTLYKNKIDKKLQLHRLLAIHFIPNPDNLPEVNHKDSNRLNFSLDNLEWVSRYQNMRHAAAKGCFNGTTNPKVRKKLTPQQAATIRKLAAEGRPRADLAEIYGISVSLVQHIVNGIRWVEAV